MRAYIGFSYPPKRPLGTPLSNYLLGKKLSSSGSQRHKSWDNLLLRLINFIKHIRHLPSLPSVARVTVKAPQEHRTWAKLCQKSTAQYSDPHCKVSWIESASEKRYQKVELTSCIISAIQNHPKNWIQIKLPKICQKCQSLSHCINHRRVTKLCPN